MASTNHTSNNNKDQLLEKDKFPIREHFKFEFENPRLFDKLDFDHMKKSNLWPIFDVEQEKENERITNKLMSIVFSNYDFFFAQLTLRMRDLLIHMLHSKFITSNQYFYKDKADFYDCMSFFRKWNVVKSGAGPAKKYSLTSNGRKVVKLLLDKDVCRHYYEKYEWIKC